MSAGFFKSAQEKYALKRDLFRFRRVYILSLALLRVTDIKQRELKCRTSSNSSVVAELRKAT